MIDLERFFLVITSQSVACLCPQWNWSNDYFQSSGLFYFWLEAY